MIPTPVVVRPAPGAVAPGLPSCTGADLALSFGSRGAASDGRQRGGTLMVVRNGGVSRCRIPALPPIAFAGPGGAALPIRFAPPPGMHPGPAVAPIGLAPGAKATAELRWTSGGASPSGRCYESATVRVTFGTAELEAPFVARFCGAEAGATFGQSWLKPGNE